MSVSADDVPNHAKAPEVPPTWHAAQTAMRQNVKYAAALDQIKIITGKGTPAYQIAEAALQGR